MGREPAVVTIKHLPRFLKCAAGRDLYCRPVVEAGHHVQAKVASRMRNDAHDRAELVLMAESQDLFELRSALQVH